ncbi:[protein release factor]-glutamine N5-methyltransferase [Chitinasiproducens palmae]|uniref:Release factor glutamine methyltransferase n=2 Tax=Chitinasiproducens palmae TaxID=1770053 RepID=A0A1H2PTH6_9BURK|nr:[protein release factor]-glutamine N5-methyltransferase [Chitinasiproducens palmae]
MRSGSDPAATVAGAGATVASAGSGTAGRACHGTSAITAADLLARARPRIGAREAALLLAEVLGWRRTELLTRDHEVLPPASVAEFDAWVARRAAGEPIAHLLGHREFFGLRLRVNAHVLIPRPETELLVEAALAWLAEPQQSARPEAPAVLDLGTGSGAIAIAIAAQAPTVRVVATDHSAEALAVARDNAQTHLPARPGGPIEFRQGDWYAALTREPSATVAGGAPTPQRFDMIVSNPPYIADGDPHLEQGDLRYEPQGALTDGADGLRALAAIIAGASDWLRDGGVLWLEHGYDQAAAVRALLDAQGFQAVASHRDLAGIERISGGRWHRAAASSSTSGAPPVTR